MAAWRESAIVARAAGARERLAGWRESAMDCGAVWRHGPHEVSLRRAAGMAIAAGLAGSALAAATAGGGGSEVGSSAATGVPATRPTAFAVRAPQVVASVGRARGRGLRRLAAARTAGGQAAATGAVARAFRHGATSLRPLAGGADRGPAVVAALRRAAVGYAGMAAAARAGAARRFVAARGEVHRAEATLRRLLSGPDGAPSAASG